MKALQCHHISQPTGAALLAQATRISPQSNPEPQSAQQEHWGTAH